MVYPGRYLISILTSQAPLQEILWVAKGLVRCYYGWEYNLAYWRTYTHFSNMREARESLLIILQGEPSLL